MEVELVPDPGAADPSSSAAVAAIVRTGLADDERSPASASAWRSAGVLEAVDRSTTPRKAAQPGAPPDRALALDDVGLAGRVRSR